MPPVPRERASYGVGIVCALPLEKAAVMGMLDEEHTTLPIADGDTNDYTLGRIGEHDVVVACLPAGMTGKASAAMAAVNMMRSFPIRIGLMVGTGGGVPSKSIDIRLGDVVVSQPTGQHGGVVQWDFGKMEREGIFRRTGTLNKPPRVLLNALAGLQARHEVEEPELGKHLEDMLARRPRMAKQYIHQGEECDVLYEGSYDHAGGDTCDGCDETRRVSRATRADAREIMVHMGNIASGDEVMKDGKTRDRIAAAEGVICFEMEAAGLMDSFPCLVIRGICDYADSHKNKRWQRYAAATAAAYAKELLLTMPAAEVSRTQRAEETTQCVHNLPFGENHHFVGRHQELEKLEQDFFGQPRRSRVAVVGLGGIGKTQVALTFAYSVWKKHPGFSVFWVAAVSTETIDKAFQEIAEKLGIITHPDERKSARTLVCKHLSSPSAGSWLLIIDNVDDEDVLERNAGTESLLSQLPRSDRGLTLFTTRYRKVAQSVAGANLVVVGKLSDEDAVSMLKEVVVDEEALEDATATRALLAELDNLPLAISQAAGYINVNGTSVIDYLEMMRSTEQDVVDIMSTEMGDNTRYDQAENAIATTWIISFERISKDNPDAAELLRYISCIEWKAIPESVLPQLPSKVRMRNAIGMLCSYSFLVERGREKVYDMHRLVHLATRIWEERYGDAAETQRRSLSHLSRIFPQGEYEKREAWRAYLPHAARIIRIQGAEDRKGEGLLCRRMGFCLLVDGKLSEAVSWLEMSCACFENLKTNNPYRLVSQHELAGAYEANGQIKEAVELLEHVVKVNAKVLEEDHPDALASQHELASAYRANRQIKEAVELLEHVVKVKAKVLEEDHPNALASQHQLALAYYSDGRVEEARMLLLHVVPLA